MSIAALTVVSSSSPVTPQSDIAQEFADVRRQRHTDPRANHLPARHYLIRMPLPM
jgi:hypothetical protein